jgi:hypothetical protein
MRSLYELFCRRAMTQLKRGTPAHGFGESVPGKTNLQTEPPNACAVVGGERTWNGNSNPSNSLPPAHGYRVDPTLKQFLNRAETGEAGA